MKRLFTLLLAMMMAVSLCSVALGEEKSPRDAMIDEILSTAKGLYDKAGGKLQSAHYAGDIYLCKNFTVHVFKQVCDRYRMAEFPDVKLVIPNNLDKNASKPNHYGIAWEDIKPENGNPFYVAHRFVYDKALSKQENLENAKAFLREVKKGDYFQMSAKYYYGVGAHSLIFIADYDAASDSVHWTDSNMKGQSKGGRRYGLAQYDAVKPVEWFADAICYPGRGATLYRLRDDMVTH